MDGNGRWANRRGLPRVEGHRMGEQALLDVVAGAIQAGVSHLWLVDPELRTLEAYARQDAHWLLLASHSEDDAVRVPPFDAIELELALLWS